MNNNLQQKNQSVYSVGSIVLGSFFGGPIATLFMAYKNSIVFNKRMAGTRYSMFILLTFLIYSAVLLAWFSIVLANPEEAIFFLSDTSFYSPVVSCLFLFIFLPNVFYSLLVWFALDKDCIDDFLKKGFKKRNFFGILLLVILSFIVMIIFVGLFLYWAVFLANHTFGYIFPIYGSIGL